MTPGQVRTIDVTHGGAATEEFTVRSLSIRQRYGAGLVQRTLRTHASTRVEQDQVSGGVSALRWHVAPVANVLWKP